MPTLSRWYIKTALVYLVAGLFASLVSAAQAPLNLPLALGAIRPVTLHLFTVGWITQMIFGVAIWMFPRATRERPRGNIPLAIAAYLLLNSGLAIRIIFEPLYTVRTAEAAGWLLVLSAGLQWAAGISFATYVWARVKER